MRLRRPVSQQVLHERLEELVERFDIATIAPDPLQLVLRYRDPLDQEVAGLIAAAFAYGRADIIVANIGGVLEAMPPSPHAYVADFDRGDAERRFAGFVHRFHKTADLVLFLERIAAIVREYGSLGGLFRSCYHERDRDIGPSLARFASAIAGDGLTAAEAKKIGYLVSSPEQGSACKRMNLYLRWMVRRTVPDVGVWTFVDPSKLVMPVDTHIHRIATFLGLTDRKSSDWKTARAITSRLAAFDAADPIRYDFALCRLGILDLCSRKRRKENCDVCLLRDACKFPVTKSK